ncbi:hypothetical protein E1B28_010955 [Marasmius oreades]|uniref:Uncharacterized protein n=1 Tax=Marasmius oreades TaxID=181124 RepID=A0A9P7RTM0_9AGAR|nr:uncharacterized protein E1B28_010955 [Marasmius oreades]KAG7089257.1 hypothetical protein E1B28_010955 [Marasmius oreades]
MAQPSSPSSLTSPTRRSVWSAYARREEDYETHDMRGFSFGSPTSTSGPSRSLSVSDGDEEGNGEIEEEGHGHRGDGHERGFRGRSLKVVDTTPRPSFATATRSHPSQGSSPTKHPSSSHSSSRSPPIDEVDGSDHDRSVSDEHQHPEELNAASVGDDGTHHHNEYHDQEHDDDEYYYDSSEDCSYTYSDDSGSLDIEVSSAQYDLDGLVEGPAINPRLIPSIHSSSGSRSTSIRRKGSSATESHWSGRSGYGSITDRKGSVVSVWSYVAGSGVEGRQSYYSSGELPPSDNVSATGDSHEEDWRRLLGPAPVANSTLPLSPDSPHFTVPNELIDDASASASSREDAASDYDIPYITQDFDQQPDFVSVASGATGFTSISSPTSSASYPSTGSSLVLHSFSGSSVSGSASGSGSSSTHHYSQSRSTMDSYGSSDRPLPLPPFLQQQLNQQRKKSLPGGLNPNLWELTNKTAFSKSPLSTGIRAKAREQPPSMMSALSTGSLSSSLNFPHDDSFARVLNAWGGKSYRDLRKEWVFRRERSGSFGSSTSSSSSSSRTSRVRGVQLGMAVPSQESWSNYLLGMFVVIREEIGREGVVAASSSPKPLPKSSADIQKLGSNKDLDGENLKSEKSREKGKAKEESLGEGQSERKMGVDTVFDSRNKLKYSKSKSSSHSQAPTLGPTPKSSSQLYGVGKSLQQRIVIRKLNDNVRRSDQTKTKTGLNAVGATFSTPTEDHTIASSRSPTSTSTYSSGLASESPSITVSPPESSSSQSPFTSAPQSITTSSSKDDLPSKEPEMSRSALLHIPSHPLGYDPLHPAVIVHKHSRVAAFSVSRHHRSSGRAGARSRMVIMLAQKSVQEAFTNTETTKKFMETALLMSFDGPKKRREKERAQQKEKNVTGLGSGNEKGKRKDKQREKEKEKGKDKYKDKKDNLRLKIRSEGQIHLSDEDGGKSSMKSGGSSRSRLHFPKSPSKSLGTKSAPANINGEDELDLEHSNAIVSGDHNFLHRRASSSVLPRSPSASVGLTAARGNPLATDDGEQGETENEHISPLRPKYIREHDYYKAYGTLDRHSSLESPPPTRTRRTSNSSLFKRLLPWADTTKVSSGSELTSSVSSHAVVGSSSSLGIMNNAYVPPWMTFLTREQQEQHKRAESAMGTLKTSFENVGLLPTLREGGDREKEKPKERDKEKKERTSLRKPGGKERDRENDVLSTVPHESLFMLLPLWPGETDAYSQHYFPFEMPHVPSEDRMFLLVYYKVLPREMSTMLNPNQRNPQPILDKRNILLPSFHIVARQVPYTELQNSGIRLPDQGLAVSGPLEQAYNTSPKRPKDGLSSAPTSLPSQSRVPLAGVPVRDCLMGSCYSRETGIEFDPEALIELGLCSVLKEDDIPATLPPGMCEEEVERSITVKLSAVGSAVVEMVWAGGLALTSFEPVGEGIRTK